MCIFILKYLLLRYKCYSYFIINVFKEIYWNIFNYTITYLLFLQIFN
ncbi:hypothetical protein SSDC_01110 [Candidatus Profftella armatura]|uniref:Uncharacterized protein n=1 Tax=Candidatus Profftella armatura TaxID=669502 RepID=S5RLV5_9PROT|nr:hypothetical protein SSDC_01110 [Candidatus Profftella armatura]